MQPNDIWRYEEGNWSGADLRGYAVEASDGHVGRVDSASADINAEYVVVFTGPWLLGNRAMLPAGMVRGIDEAAERVEVRCTRQQIQEAPEFDETMYREQSYRDKLSAHYRPVAALTISGSNGSER